LLEVLIAVAIMTMISTLIFTAFSSLQRSRDGIRRVSDRYREGRMALARISRELEGAYVSAHQPINLNIAAIKTAFVGEQDTPADVLHFNAFVHRRMDRDVPESDQSELSYFGMEDPNEGGIVDLVRRSSPRLDLEYDKGGTGQVLAKDIDLFALEYLDPLTGQWTEEWDSTAALGQLQRLPLQVHVTLVLNGGGRLSEDSSRRTITFSTKVSLPMQAPLSFAVE
jgi:general secretion pathway protein J